MGAVQFDSVGEQRHGETVLGIFRRLSGFERRCFIVDFLCQPVYERLVCRIDFQQIRPPGYQDGDWYGMDRLLLGCHVGLMC